MGNDLRPSGGDGGLAAMDERTEFITVVLWEAENPKRYAVAVAGDKTWAAKGYTKAGIGTAIFKHKDDTTDVNNDAT